MTIGIDCLPRRPIWPSQYCNTVGQRSGLLIYNHRMVYLRDLTGTKAIPQNQFSLNICHQPQIFAVFLVTALSSFWPCPRDEAAKIDQR